MAREAEHRRQIEAAEAGSGDSTDPNRVRLANAGAYASGIAPGFARGLYHQARDGLDLGIMYSRMTNPILDSLLSPPGQTAPEQIGSGMLNAGAYAIDRAAHPSKIRSDVAAAARQANVSLNPTVGYAPTAQARARRYHEAGKNAGEVVSNLATMAMGGGEAKLLHELGYFGKLPTVETYLARGIPQKTAEYFAGPYTGRQGSHFIPQRMGLPKVLADSPFNRIMPAPGATAGQMSEFHYRADDRFRGGRIKKAFGGGGWSGLRLGWTKPPAPVRWWRGMPLPTKALGYGAMAGLGGLVPEQPRR